MSDDPFDLDRDDPGLTQARPVRRPLPPTRPVGGPPNPTPTHGGFGAERIAQSRAGENPLVSAFSVLLGLAPELERADAPSDPGVLNARIYNNIVYACKTWETEMGGEDRALQAAWFVAALIDDIVLHTPWGRNSAWPGRPLVTQLSNDVDAGEQFYDRVARLMQNPGRDRDMLELAYYCLSLGFRGQYRPALRPGGEVSRDHSGEARVTQLIGEIEQLLGPGDHAELSPRWRGVAAPEERKRFVVPLWAIPVIAAAILALVYGGLSLQVSARASDLQDRVAALPPETRVDVAPPIDISETIEAITQGPPQAQPVPVTVVPVLPTIELAPLILAAAPPNTVGALTIEEDDREVRIIIQADSPEVFRSAQAALNDVYGPLIVSIARVIVENSDSVQQVVVTGHTDSRNLTSSPIFASNQELSEGRAMTVGDALIAAGVDPSFVVTEGEGEEMLLIDPEQTASDRARNRRVEIVILKRV
ncbi:MAG: type IVB secretion system protein IcmH/DotU [Pseudomonadota bacterium]